MSFLEIFSIGADALSYISLIFSAITLFTTMRIRKSLLSHIEKSDYLSDIDNRIKILRSYEDTITKDFSLCNDSLFDLIAIALDDIVISYENILNKKIIAQIKSLQIFVGTNKGPRNTDAKKAECKKQLHAICTRLEKEKKII